MQIIGEARIGDVAGGNYLEISTTGIVTPYGTAIVPGLVDYCFYLCCPGIRRMTVGSVLYVEAQTEQVLQYVSTPAPPAINDAFTFPTVALRGGTYALYAMARTGSNRGIVTWAINAADIGTTDLYSAAPTANVEKTITGITVASGNITLTGRMATKHASSSDYHSYLTYVLLVRTGD